MLWVTHFCGEEEEGTMLHILSMPRANLWAIPELSDSEKNLCLLCACKLQQRHYYTGTHYRRLGRGIALQYQAIHEWAPQTTAYDMLIGWVILMPTPHRLHTYQLNPCLFDGVYFSRRAVNFKSEYFCSKLIWVTDWQLICNEADLKLGRWELWKLCHLNRCLDYI